MNRENLRSYQFPIVGAFVTFEHERTRDACYFAMNNYKWYKMNGPYPPEFLFNGETKFKIARATEPYMVLWENYNIS